VSGVPRIPIDRDKIAEFCRRWRVVEFSLFGSVLRDDFGPDSDVDVLVRLQPDHGLSLFDWVEMIEELKRMFGRGVDLVEREGLLNPFRRHSILASKQVIYAACGSRPADVPRRGAGTRDDGRSGQERVCHPPCSAP